MKKRKKPLPHFGSDEEAAHFVDEADLSEYDLSGFEPLSSYAFARKDSAQPKAKLAGVAQSGGSSSAFRRNAKLRRA